jgi:uncharacterized protein YraI
MMRRKFILAAFTLLAALSIAIAGTPASVQAQGNVVWNVEYYNNVVLQNAVVRATSTGVAFNWGTNAPATGVQNDNFSARLGTDVYLPAGTYRFYAMADDAVRVFIDFNNTVIDTFGQTRVGQLLSGDLTVGDGTHHIQIDYAEFGGDAYLYFSFENAANARGPQFGSPITQPVVGGAWTAQYYANTALADNPVLIQSEGQPGGNWGEGSPGGPVPANQWSARWTAALQMNAGLYLITARADDGVRVYVDGNLVIDKWRTATGETYTATVSLTAGSHNWIVEFLEYGGVAFLEFNVGPTTQQIQPTPNPQQPQNPVGPATGTATVNTSRLNVREQPDPVNGRIIRIVRRGESYPVLARNTDNTWIQLNVNGTPGWVSARFVTVNAGSVPVVQPVQPTPVVTSPTGYFVTATPLAVNIRIGPATTYRASAVLPRNAQAPVIGRTADGLWWQVNYNGITGWVSAPYAPIQAGANTALIPITW